LTVAIHFACLLVFLVPFSWSLVALAAGGYLLRMWAITAGYHRYFAHRAYRTSRVFHFLLGWLGACAMENGPIWWASIHRRHHKDSDGPLDPHSPTKGLWHSHMGWFFGGKYDGLDMSNVKDLAAYPELRFIENYNSLPIISYAVACFAISGFSGLVWGFCVSTIAVLHATAFVNSLAHVFGSRRYETNDLSRNNAFLAVLTLGEGWHNNHHHYQSSARQGFFWWEIDVSYYTIRLLAVLGIVSSVREPPKTVVAGPLAKNVDRVSQGALSATRGPATDRV
jgi:stearoyl-CoA desaturase (delta-9 desaturase)